MNEDVGNTDRIEKRIVLRASRELVWRAVTDAREFGAWFGVDFGEAAFLPGATVRGRITTPGYEHLTMEIVIDRIEPEKRFSFRWHPYAVDPRQDYSAEPMTLVVFDLRDAPDGTLLTVTESGFDGLPPQRRAEAFQMDDRGWAAQMKNIDGYLGRRG